MWIFRLSAGPAATGRPDFLATPAGAGCLFSERAVACLEELLAPDGEFLPVACATGTFSVYHCRRRLAQATRTEGAQAFRIGLQVGCAPGDVARLVWESGIGYLQPFVAEHLAPAIRLRPSSVAASTGLVGATDHECGCGLPLLLQINLAGVNAPPLPPAGLLSFFGDGDRLAVRPGAPPGQRGPRALSHPGGRRGKELRTG